MKKKYTTREILELSYECALDDKFMNKVWIPKENLKRDYVAKK